MHYPDRLKQLNLRTVTYRRSRGDMIETYKLLTGTYDQQVALALPKNVTGEYFTRSNSNKLLVNRCRYDLSNNFFRNRIVNMWNSLPDYRMSLFLLSSTFVHEAETNIGSRRRYY